jgi:hypothetical protein
MDEISEEKTYRARFGRLPGSMLQPLDDMDPMTFYGRCLALVALLAWSWYLFGYDYRYGEIGTSFMHDILLPIHEAGHVLFRPFGHFMMVLGGSLFQLLVPIGIAGAFMLKNHDNFGAAIGAWWAGVSLVDLSPYVYDALAPRLTLIGGGTGADGPHDWIYILLSVGQLANSQRWGAGLHAAGGILMLLSLIWAGLLLWRQYTQLGEGA